MATIKRIVYLNEEGLLHRTQQGDITNIGGTSHTSFTVGGRNVQLEGTSLNNSFTYVQSTPASTWTVAHNKHSKKVIWSLWDENDETIMAEAVRLLDSDTIQIEFMEPQTGRLEMAIF
jgi:hypothetical protein